jgi:hypothetical protein
LSKTNKEVFNTLSNEQWASWQKECNFISYLYEGARHYYHILRRDWSHIEVDWPNTVDTLTSDGPHIFNDVQPTEADKPFQVIFGFQPQGMIYVNLPQETMRHGVPRRPTMTAAYRPVAHYRSWETPYYQPSWITEHWLFAKFLPFAGYTYYNTEDITLQPTLNFYLGKCELEHIGDVWVTEEAGRDAQGRQVTTQRYEVQPAESPRFDDLLMKLHQRLIPSRPLTLQPVRSMARGV